MIHMRSPHIVSLSSGESSSWNASAITFTSAIPPITFVSPVSHNMAIFPHFWTFLVTFGVVTTTFMHITCTERTQTLVTCMVDGTHPFCPSPGTYMAQGGIQNMAIFWVKTGLLWRACYGARTQPGNRFMCHITSHYMAKQVFRPSLTCPATFMAQEGSKIWPFCG